LIHHSRIHVSIAHYTYDAMTNYVPSIPDCERWKKYVSKLAKGRSESKLNSYVTSDSPSAEIKVVSPTEGELAMIKTRVKQYKGKTKQTKRHTTPKGEGRKTSQRKSSKKKQNKQSSQPKKQKQRGRPKKIKK
jgi:hypothetical protein